MADLGGWTETILLSLAFVTVLGLIVTGMNLDYNQDNSIGLTDTSTETLFLQYGNASQGSIEGGQVELNSAQGITLKDSYDLMKDLMNVIWSFISGGWIEKIANMMNLGTAGMIIAKTLRIIYFISLIFILLYILFKVRP